MKLIDIIPNTEIFRIKILKLKGILEIISFINEETTAWEKIY